MKTKKFCTTAVCMMMAMALSAQVVSYAMGPVPSVEEYLAPSEEVWFTEDSSFTIDPITGEYTAIFYPIEADQGKQCNFYMATIFLDAENGVFSRNYSDLEAMNEEWEIPQTVVDTTWCIGRSDPSVPYIAIHGTAPNYDPDCGMTYYEWVRSELKGTKWERAELLPDDHLPLRFCIVQRTDRDTDADIVSKTRLCRLGPDGEFVPEKRLAHPEEEAAVTQALWSLIPRWFGWPNATPEEYDRLCFGSKTGEWPERHAYKPGMYEPCHYNGVKPDPFGDTIQYASVRWLERETVKQAAENFAVMAPVTEQIVQITTSIAHVIEARLPWTADVFAAMFEKLATAQH